MGTRPSYGEREPDPAIWARRRARPVRSGRGSHGCPRRDWREPRRRDRGREPGVSLLHRPPAAKRAAATGRDERDLRRRARPRQALGGSDAPVDDACGVPWGPEHREDGSGPDDGGGVAAAAGGVAVAVLPDLPCARERPAARTSRLPLVSELPHAGDGRALGAVHRLAVRHGHRCRHLDRDDGQAHGQPDPALGSARRSPVRRCSADGRADGDRARHRRRHGCQRPRWPRRARLGDRVRRRLRRGLGGARRT